MIRKYILRILMICSLTMLLPTAALATDSYSPTVSGRNIYGNGTALIVEGADSEHTTVYIDSNRNGAVDIGEPSLQSAGIANAPNDSASLSSWTILGGAQTGNLTGDSMVTVNSGSIGDVFGGGNYSSTGNITIVLNGGSVKRLIATAYWGGNVGGPNNTVSISVHGGNVRGGANDDIDMISRIETGTAKTLTIDGGTINGTVSGATPTNGTEEVFMTTLTLKDGATAKANTAVTALTLSTGAYGMDSVTTNSSGQLVVYIPENTTVTAATIGEVKYVGSVTAGNVGELLKVIPPLWTDSITANANSEFSGGNGTQDLPYLLSNAEDLAQLAVNVNTSTNCYTDKYFKLTQNIDLSEKNWVPIGFTNNARFAFRGNFDGGSHIISNISINYSSCGNANNYLGFFGWIYGGNDSGGNGAGASVKNLSLTNASLLIDDNINSGSAGMLIGYADRGITIDNCFATGNIITTGTVKNIGGLVGENGNGMNGSMTNCYYIGKITVVGGTSVGGILGFQGSITPTNCYAAATITSSSTNKYAVASSATNCFYDSTLNTTAIIGQGTPKSTVEMKAQETAGALGAAWGYNAGINNGYPYLVSMKYAPEITLSQSNVSVNNLNENASLVLASYAEGRLLDIKIYSTGTPESIDISETELVTQGADKLKAMLLKNPINICPLCEVTEVSYCRN